LIRVMEVLNCHPSRVNDAVGCIPSFLSEDDPRPAREQLHQNYAHGGGWDPVPRFKMDDRNRLLYPGDPPMFPLVRMYLRDEEILIYISGWVAIKQKNGSFEVSRMD